MAGSKPALGVAPVPGARPGLEAARQTCLDPEAIADAHVGPIGQDRSCWSQEIDLRPSVEAF